MLMKPTNIYSAHRYPKEIISDIVWLYHRFILSFRDVKDILTYSGIEVSYESIREWCLKFGIIYVKP